MDARFFVGGQVEQDIGRHFSTAFGISWKHFGELSYPIDNLKTGTVETRSNKQLDYITSNYLLRARTKALFSILRPRIFAGFDYGVLVSGPEEASSFTMNGIVGVGSIIEVQDMMFTIDARLDFGFVEKLPGAEGEDFDPDVSRRAQSYGIVIGYRWF